MPKRLLVTGIDPSSRKIDLSGVKIDNCSQIPYRKECDYPSCHEEMAFWRADENRTPKKIMLGTRNDLEAEWQKAACKENSYSRGFGEASKLGLGLKSERMENKSFCVGDAGEIYKK